MSTDVAVFEVTRVGNVDIVRVLEGYQYDKNINSRCSLLCNSHQHPLISYLWPDVFHCSLYSDAINLFAFHKIENTQKSCSD